MSNTKKGVVLTGAKQITIEERLLPKPGPGEGIVKVELCGICGSDLHGWEAGGAVYPLGTLMGHEAVGTVTDVGEGVSALKTGDKVAINGFSPCGYCVACRRGLSNACVNNLDRTIGNSDKLDGAFADYIWLPDADLMAVKVPDDLSQEDAALAEFDECRFGHARQGQNPHRGCRTVCTAGLMSYRRDFFVRLCLRTVESTRSRSPCNRMKPVASSWL